MQKCFFAPLDNIITSDGQMLVLLDLLRVINLAHIQIIIIDHYHYHYHYHQTINLGLYLSSRM